ncbi:MAG TPA: hypothetical protein VF743_07420 [Acidimicrobiales bacterium]
MSDFEPPTTDPDQPGEAFDDDLLDGQEFPPDRPLAVDKPGVTEQEERAGETVEERDRHTEPEVWERPLQADTPPPVLEDLDDPAGDAPTVDDEKDLVAPPVPQDDVGPLADGDAFTGDETTRDVANELVPPPAEEAAVHTRPGAPGATG